MSTRNLVRHVFRYGSRAKAGENAVSIDVPRRTAALDESPIKNERHTSAIEAGSYTAQSSMTRTPELLRLEGIVEEDAIDTPSSSKTASLSDSFAPTDHGVNVFSAREIIHAVLREANETVSSHLDTINTTLVLLKALDGFSATIETLSKEMLATKHVCEEKISMLRAVERAISDMAFNGETQEEAGDD